MRFKALTTALLSVLLVAATRSAHAEVIYQWTFENVGQMTVPPAGMESGHLDPVITDGEPFVFGNSDPDIYAKGQHANASTGWLASASNGPSAPGTDSWRSNFWQVGDYWELNFIPTGWTDLKLSFDMYRSFSGAKNFKIETSADGVGYVDLAGSDSTLPSSSTWYALGTFSLPDDTVSVRITATSAPTSSSGSDQNRIDNAIITGTLVPEPSSLALLGMAIVGLTAAHRWSHRRRKAS